MFVMSFVFLNMENSTFIKLDSMTACFSTFVLQTQYCTLFYFYCPECASYRLYLLRCDEIPLGFTSTFPSEDFHSPSSP